MRGRFFIALLAILSLALAWPPVVRAQSRYALPALDDPGLTSLRHRLPPAQPYVPSPPDVGSPGPPVLSRMSRAAGMIFSGRVIAIARVPASERQPIATVAVTFHVERAIRGVRKGESLKIMQWAGLWSQGQHYVLGERVLLFLYPRSRLGLTSSVGGPLGRFSLDSGGRVLLSELHSSAFAADPVLGGKSRVAFSDFAQNVRRAVEEE